MNEITTTQKTAVMHTVQDIWQMARAIAASGLFGMRAPEQAMGLMLVAQAEGRHPAIVARDYHIIQGRPALKADAMLARFQEAGGKLEWTQYGDDCCEAELSHPAAGKPIRLKWTIDMAKKAGLYGKEGGNWQKYPRQMLSARVISEGIRKVYPAVICGSYTPEEVVQFEQPAGPAQMTASKTAIPAPPELEQPITQPVDQPEPETAPEAQETPKKSDAERIDEICAGLALQVEGYATAAEWDKLEKLLTKKGGLYASTEVLTYYHDLRADWEMGE